MLFFGHKYALRLSIKSEKNRNNLRFLTCFDLTSVLDYEDYERANFIMCLLDVIFGHGEALKLGIKSAKNLNYLGLH